MRARGWLRRAGLSVPLLVLGTVILWSLAPTWFTSVDPVEGVAAQRLRPPSAQHWFGTDQLGRDMYARVVHGATLSLQATIIAVLLALVVGSAMGAVAGFAGGRLDTALIRMTDVLLAIPGLLLALAIVSALGFGLVNVAIGVGVASVASVTRVMRAEVLRIRGAAFVEAARVNGVRPGVTLLVHVLPNAIGPVLALAALDVGSVLLTVSALSFLGFGAAPPTPEWGSLVSSGRDFLRTAWWITTFPGLVIGVVVLATNVLARGLERTRRESW